MLLVLIQLVPYGRDHTNPPVTAGPRWDSPRTEQLFTNACGDCHSNLTQWPWYSNVAPVSWLTQRDVDEGRGALNVSVAGEVEVDEMVEAIRAGSMPPWFYTIPHRNAALSSAEKDELINGLTKTFGGGAAGRDAAGPGGRAGRLV